MQQLDIFLDTRSTLLANDVIAALVGRDVDRARLAINALRSEDAAHADLAAFDTVWQFLAAGAAVDGGELLAHRQRLDTELVPAARVLGVAGAAFIRPFWRALADAAAGRPEIAAEAWLRGGEPARAEAVARTVVGGQHLAHVQRWLTLSSQAQGGLRAAPQPLFRHAWLAPDEFPTLLDELADAEWRDAWRRFSRDLGDLSDDWFPAWYVADHPATPVDEIDLPPRPAAHACMLVARLHALEKQGIGQSLLVKREKLKRCGEAFFAWYMGRRQTRHR